MKLTRYWIRFDQNTGNDKVNILGYGVTAHDLDDAQSLLRQTVFRGSSMPEIVSIEEDIDVSTLDPNHILPNIGVCSNRGVWYPNM